MLVLNTNQTKIMEHLNRFRFLTVSQLIRLGISKDRSHVNRLLRSLRSGEKPLIAGTNYGADPVKGKLESVHHLTAYGQKVLQELSPQELKTYDSSGVQAYKDYFHRLNTIDIHIAFHQFCERNEYEIVIWENYFDRLKNGKQGGIAATKLELPSGGYLMADALSCVDKNGKPVLFAIEMYNGKDVTRTVQQLKQHAEALADCSVGKAYGLEQAHWVICVFEEPTLMSTTLEAMENDPIFEHVKHYYLFRTLETVRLGDPPISLGLLSTGEVGEW